MPKYQNRSGEMVTVNEITFSPFEIKSIPINLLITGTTIFKLEDEPKFNPYKCILSNAVLNSKTEPFNINHTHIIRIDDNYVDFYSTNELPTNNIDGNSLVLGLFASVGPPENLNSYSLVQLYEFRRKYNSWLYNGNGVPMLIKHLIDYDYEHVYLKVLEASLGSTVDISIKYY